MNAKIGLTAADGWNHECYRDEPKRAAKGRAPRTLPLYVHRAGCWFQFSTPAVRTSHAKLALRRRLDYCKQHVGRNIPNRGRE